MCWSFVQIEFWLYLQGFFFSTSANIAGWWLLCLIIAERWFVKANCFLRLCVRAVIMNSSVVTRVTETDLQKRGQWPITESHEMSCLWEWHLITVNMCAVTLRPFSLHSMHDWMIFTHLWRTSQHYCKQCIYLLSVKPGCGVCEGVIHFWASTVMNQLLVFQLLLHYFFSHLEMETHREANSVKRVLHTVTHRNTHGAAACPVFRLDLTVLYLIILH